MKLMPQQRHRRASQIALVERADIYYTLPISGAVRSDWHPNMPLGGGEQFRTSPYFAAHTTYGGGKRWLNGYSRTDFGEQYHPLLWSDEDGGWLLGPEIAPQTNDSEPIPLLVRPDPADPTHVYVLFDSGKIAKFNMALDPWEVDVSEDALDWTLRTGTPHHIDDGSGTNWGRGWRGSLTTDDNGFGVISDLGIEPFNPFGTELYATELLMEDIATGYPANHKPGYGIVGYGKPVNFWPVDSADPDSPPDWYALGRFYFQGDSETALDLEGQPVSAAVVLLRLVAGEEPSTLTAWNSIVAVHTPANPTTRPLPELGYSSPHFWTEFSDTYAYYVANPKQHGSSSDTSGGGSAAVVFAIGPGRGVPQAVLSWPTGDTYGTALCKTLGVIYAVLVSVGDHKVYLYGNNPASEPTGWSLVSEYAWSGDPHIGAAWGYSGVVHVLLGQEPGLNGTTFTGVPTVTGWEILNYTVGTDTWTRTVRSFPGPQTSSQGLDGRMFTIAGSAVETGGGGGGGGGTGPCDDTFSAFGTSTISPEVFADELASYGSPLADDPDASWYYDMLVSAGLNPAFALAQWHKETKYGTVLGEMPASAHNVALIRYVGRPLQTGSHHTICCGSFATYSAWQNGATDYAQIVGGPLYAGKSISEIINLYAPSSDGNNSELYISQVCANMQTWADLSGITP